MEPYQTEVRFRGWRDCQEVIEKRNKAWRVKYYSWYLWIPIKALAYWGDQLLANPRAIERAKDHGSARHISDGPP